ncbi:MAG: hypothetical protein LKI93_03435 [Bifidobacteriaceae bacterium]|jgi:hypothetical protein|nr:hypothetical protein [Bifidobacteriaceae bacterium]
MNWEMISALSDAAMTLVTVPTLFYAIKQFKQSTSDSLHQRNEDQRRHEDELRKRAGAVHAWPVKNESLKETAIMLHNGTESPIRNVKLTIAWPDSPELICKAPSFSEHWKIVPPGTWIIRLKRGKTGEYWSTPDMVDLQTRDWEPVFLKEDKTVKCLCFTDQFEHAWKRNYGSNTGKDSGALISLDS